MSKMDQIDLVIIGSGPAGYTAGIYTARANIQTLLFEGFNSGIAGGQLMTTTLIENFPGFPSGIMGSELMENMKKQAEKFSVRILPEDVKKVDLATHPFQVVGSKTSFKTNALILATGARAKRADIPGCGDNEFWQKGVSACAVCDGAAPIFRNKEIYVIGGGDSAVGEAIFLTKFASKVYIVHRREKLRAADILSKRAFSNPKIEVLFNSEIVSVSGDKVVTQVEILNKLTNTREKKQAGGVFFAIGHLPNTQFLNGQIKLNEDGYIISKPGTTLTNIEGVFAAGDVQDFRYRQAITAAGSGCMAALDAEKWLDHKGLIRR
jgi:thioredoxin reductase (NADPH)